MSEFNPFSAGEQAPEYTPEAEQESAGSRKSLLALGGVAAVAVAAGAFLFLGGGGDEEEDFVIKRAARSQTPATAAAPAAKLPAASKLTLGRNPFRALYVAPAAAAAPAAPAPGSVAAPAPVGGAAPVVVVDSGPAPAQPVFQPPPAQPAPAKPAPAKPAPAPAPAQSTVALKGVVAGKDGANPTATFLYDGKTVSGAPGDVMAGKLLVISIQRDSIGGWFANLQLGDGSPFEVHERQTVVVQ